MASLIIKIGAKTDEYSKALDDIKKQTRGLESGLGTIGKASAVAFAGATASIAGFIKAAANTEKVASQFEVLTGSAQEANRVLNDLKDFSAGTPFQFDEIAQAGKKLIAFGIETGNVKDRLKEIGDVAAATGANFGEVTTIFGQIQAAGKLTGERLLQLQERAIPIGPALAESLGIAESELKDFVSQGKVSAEEFNKAFATLSGEGGVAFGGLEKVSATLEGKISTLKDNFSLLASEIGKQFLPLAKQVADVLINLFTFLRSNPEIAKRIAVFAGLTATLGGTIAAVTGAALAFLKLRAAFLAVSKTFPLLGKGIKGLVGATGIGLLLIIANEVYQNWNTVLPAAQSVLQTFINNGSKLLGGFGDLLIGAFTLDLDKIKSGFNQLKNVALQGFEDAKQAIKDANPDDDKPSLVPSEQSERDKIKRNAAAVTEETISAEEAEKERRAAEREKAFEEENARREEDLERLRDYRNLEREVELDADIEEAKRNRERRKQFIKDEKEFGKTYAQINKVVTDDRVQGVAAASSQLTKLQQSENSRLKSIGKAAARAQNAIDTAKGAMSAYAALAPIPFVGPYLGAAAAAALIQFGAEQDRAISAANTGGLIGSRGGAGTANVDSQLLAATPGEFVAPRQNFDEVVSGVARERGMVEKDANVDPDTGESLDEGARPGGGGGSTINVTVGTFIGTEEFVQQAVIPAIRDAREFNNSDIGS
jgi:tape measure domain-containing protein